MLKRLGWLILLASAGYGTGATANDDFIWASYGGHQGHFDAPYLGLGFMADSWGAELGLVTRSDYSGRLYYEPPPQDSTLIAQNEQTGFPVYLSILKGYAPNDRIALYTSLGLLFSTRCDIVESNNTHDRYCANQDDEVEMIPGAGALFTMGELTLGFGYQHGIGPLLSLGTDF